MDKQLVTTAIWKETRYLLGLLAAKLDQTQVQTMHDLVSEALAEEQEKS